MPDFFAKLIGPKRRNATRRGLDDARRGRRFSPGTEPLEGRIILSVVNLAMTYVSTVDANDNPISVYAGQPFYIRADFTAENLPSNIKPYTVRFMTSLPFENPIDSPTTTDGAGGFFNEIYAYHIFAGPFTGASGLRLETITASVNPNRYVTETAATGVDPYKDDSLSKTFSPINAASKLVVNAQPPSPIIAGAVFGLTVNVEDVFSNVVYNDDHSVTLSLSPDAPAGSVLTGNLTVMPINGLATFGPLTLNKATIGSSEVLDLSSPGLIATTTNAIVVGPTTATQVVILQQPNPSVVAGFNFGLIAAIMDPFGNIVMDDSTTEVTASLASGAGGLAGLDTLTVSHGQATFGGLIDDTASLAPITLKLTGKEQVLGMDLAPATSNNVVVSPAAASKLVIVQQPSSVGTVGQPFSTQPIIYDEDHYGNIETGDNSTVVTAVPVGGVGPLQGASVVVSGGVATFASLADSKAETLSLKFTSGNLAYATSNVPIVVGKATPTFKWSPAAIPIGTALGAAQLDAIAVNVDPTVASTFDAPVAGTFAYSPAPGTVLMGLGPHQLMATFTPTDSSDYTTATATTSVDVRLATTTTLTVSATSTIHNQPVKFAAAVVATAGGATPTGSVTFLDGSTVLGTFKLDGTGQANFSTTSLPPGPRSITARYSGDSSYAPSTSLAASIRVRPSTVGDFDGDGKSDIAVFDQAAATFLILKSGGGSTVQQLGNTSHVNIPIAGDFDGDGKTDLAIFDQTSAVFIILESGGGSIVQQLGNSSHVNIPVAGDFDGDGKTDLAVFDQTSAVFIILKSGGGSIVQQLGNTSHVNIPVAGDFDGDGKTDLAVFDQASAVFIILKSGGGSIVQQLGNTSHLNVPIAADFDGDGKTDLAIFDPSSSVILALKSGGGSVVQQLGNASDVNVPVVGDFDGDGRTDVAVFDQSSAVFLVLESDGGSIVQQLGNKKHVNIPV